MTRRQFRLLKDTPEIKAGGIIVEKCDNGDQDFETLNSEFFQPQLKTRVTYGREIVLNSPEWFEEIFDVWLPKAAFDKLKKLLGI